MWGVYERENDKPLVQYVGPLQCEDCKHFESQLEDQGDICIEHLYCKRLKVYINQGEEELDVCLVKEYKKGIVN